MKKSFVELLNEIVNDFKQIHINIKNNRFKEIDVFSKISELLRLAEEVENYTPENISCLNNLNVIIRYSFSEILNDEYLSEIDEQYLDYYFSNDNIRNCQIKLELFIKNNNVNIDEITRKIKRNILSEDYKYDIFEFEKQFSHILKNTSSVNKNTQTIKPPLKFIDLFKIPYNTVEKITILKEILKNNEYIGQDNKWVGITKKKNELAFLYDLFNEKNILKDESFELQIKTFYKEFGLIVYNDKETKSGGYCTLKNLRITRSNQNETYKNFEIIFSDWVK